MKTKNKQKLTRKEVMKLTEELLKKLQIEDLLYDTVFKHIFLEHPPILMELIKEAINYDFDADKDDVIVLNELLPKRRLKDRGRYVDTLLFVKNRDIINIEVNRKDFSPEKAKRMLNYLNILYGRRHKIKNEFYIKDSSGPRFIQVHLNTGAKKSKSLITKYNIRADSANDLYIDDYEIWVINIDNCYEKVDKYRDLGYNGCDRSLLKMAVFHSSSIYDVTELMIKGGMKDSMVEDLKKTIVSKNEDPKFIEELFQERDLELEKKEIAEYNKEQGREEGREEGRNESTQNIINKLISKGLSDKDIGNLLDISPKQLTKFKKVA